VVVDRCLREAKPVGDLADRRRVVALVYEQLQRYVEDPLARVGLPGLSRGLWSEPLPLSGTFLSPSPLLDGRSESPYYPFGKYR